MTGLRQRIRAWLHHDEHPGADATWSPLADLPADDGRLIAPAADYEPRHAHVEQPAGPDYSPLEPAARQALAPTYYADRALHAGPDDRTGVLDPTSISEVTP